MALMDVQTRVERPTAGRKRVVIVGAGFAGLNAAKALGDAPGVDVIVVDRRNHHLFQPLLYQVATAALSPADIAVPIREELARFRNVEVHLGEVTAIDLAARTVHTAELALPYDYLILACGAKHSYFGHEEWEPNAPGLKTLEQATEIRYRVLSAFEQAENAEDDAERRAWLTFAVVGGGPTGVELAGALSEIARTALSRDFKRINPKDARVVLLEAGPRILTMFGEELSGKALDDLHALGVETRLGQPVTAIDDHGLVVGGDRLPTRTVLWAAGVQPSGLNRLLSTALDKAGRAVVEADQSLPNHPEVFILGDQAHSKGADGKPLPGLAPVAIQQGGATARNILRDLAGEPREPFKYFDKGQMATIGRQRAVAETNGIRITGFLAWAAWLFIHVLYLVGFRNRLSVMSAWVWSYVFGKRNARLIVSKAWRSYGDEGEI